MISLFLYVLYPVSLIYISMFVSGTKYMTIDSYFFANRNMHWFLLGISIFTTCICSPYIFGLTAVGLASGLPLIYVLISVIMLTILGWFLIPLFFKIKIDTIPEYFEKRFNKPCRFYLSAVYILSNIFIRLLIVLVAGSTFINLITGLDAYSSLLFFLVVTGIYITIGGLQAEIYVNALQIIFIIFGIIAFSGWAVQQGISDNIVDQNATLQAGINFAESDFEWTGLILGLPVIGFWFWCADQLIVQKVISVRTVNSARKATLVSTILQILPFLFFILPGIFLTFLHDQASENSLFTLFANGNLPDSIKLGLILAVASALMASFASLFNSTSALITFDFYRAFKPTASDRKLVLVGRLTTMTLVFCSIILIPVSQSIDFGVCLKLFKILAYFVSMIASVFIIGLVNKKITGKSALLTLYLGTCIILVRAAFELFYYQNSFESVFARIFIHSGFFDFSFFMFLLSTFCLFAFDKLSRINKHVNLTQEMDKTKLQN